MLNGQQKIMLSKYTELYELLIPKSHMLKQFNDLVDFSFVYDELASINVVTKIILFFSGLVREEIFL